MNSNNYNYSEMYVNTTKEGLLKEIIYDYCARDSKGVFYTELQWLSPDLALRFEPNDINEAIQNSQGMNHSIEWEKMTVREFVTTLGPSIFTGSCGNTSNILEEIISGRVESQSSKELPKGDPSELIQALNEKIKTHPLIYCRVETTNHSFIIEYYQGKFQIYQSFFGRHTLQKYLDNSQSWPKETFLDLLTTALTYKEDRSDHKMVQSLLQLFHYRNVSNERVAYRFIEPLKSIEAIKNSLIIFTERHRKAWDTVWEEPISKFVVRKEKFTPSSIEKIEGEKNIRKLYPYFLDETLSPVSKDTPLEKGSVYYFKDIPYLLAQTTQQDQGETIYTFVWIESLKGKQSSELIELYHIEEKQAQNAIEIAQSI